MTRKIRAVKIPEELAEHKGFAKLVTFASKVGEKEGCDWTCALNCLQLSDRPERDRYDGDPSNTTPFARMGCDGVHYSFLHLDGKVQDASPVVQINPMDGGEEFEIVGSDLTDFIGRYVKQQRTFLKTASSEVDMPEDDIAAERETLNRLVETFNANPWDGYRTAKFLALQRRYLPDLEIDFEKLPWLKNKRRFRR